MRQRTIAVAAAVGAAVLAAAPAAGGIGYEETIRLVEREVSNRFVDVPPAQAVRAVPGVGDVGLFTSLLLGPAGKGRLGTLRGSCTFLRVTPRFVGSTALCTVSYRLKGGEIMAATAVTFSSKPIRFAVIGGTGAYEGARGSGVTTDRKGDSPLSDTVIHLLP
jgi:allene oxide cyclase-like protein